jgi:hypothetical protein
MVMAKRQTDRKFGADSPPHVERRFKKLEKKALAFVAGS